MKTRSTLAALVPALTLIFCVEETRGAAIGISLAQQGRTGNNGVMGTIDLTAGGSVQDWLKTGGTDLMFAEKDGVSLLSLTQLGAGALATYNDDGFFYSYSGGDANSPSGSSFTGTRNSNVMAGAGFRLEFTAPAAGDFSILWYTAANQPLKWTMTATIGALSDTETPLGLSPGNNGVEEMVWTISGTADAPGQVVTIDLVANTGTSTGSLAMLGANVTVVPEPGSALVLACGLAGLVGVRRHRRAGLAR